MKKILSLLLIICICFCAVGCNKVTDTNSSDLSSTITETKNESVCVDEQKDSANNNTTEESFPNTSPNNTPTTSSSKAPDSIETQTTGGEHYHIYSGATCTHPRTCSCGATIGSVREHNWEEATCQKPKTCYNCGKIEGEKIEHVFNYSICMWCGIKEYTFENPYIDMLDSSYQVTYSSHPTVVRNYSLVITSKNELYKFCKDKKFSNGSYFMKIESNLKFVKFIHDGRVMTDHNIYLVTENNQLYAFDGATEQVVPCTNPFSCSNYKTIFNGKAPRGYQLLRCENNNIYSEDGEILYSFPQDEIITLALDGIIKTSKGLYSVSYIERYEQEFADSESI